MNIEIYDSNLTAKDVRENPVQIACRGLVVKDGKILTVRAARYDITMLPGGRVEADESFAETVVREVLEETGVQVHVQHETVRVIEHFQGHSFLNVYHLCDYVNDTETTHFTEEEVELGFEIVWWDKDDLLDNLATNETLHAHGTNIHNREFLGVIHSLEEDR